MTCLQESAYRGVGRLDSETVQLTITSPPYWMLRDYGVDGQIGMEPTPEEYIKELSYVFGELLYKTKVDGACVVVIGDTYFGGGSSTAFGNDFANFKGKSTLAGTHPGGSRRPIKPRKHDHIQVGEQIGIPWMFAAMMRSLGWMVRQDVIWQKPNPMPGPWRKRFTSCHEHIFIFTRSMKYQCNRPAFSTPSGIMRDVLSWPVDGGGHHANAGFPEALVERFMEGLSARCSLVFDPFCGGPTGTTARVAERLERRFLGIDLFAGEPPLQAIYNG